MQLICPKYKYLKVMVFNFLKTALELSYTTEIIHGHCRKFWKIRKSTEKRMKDICSTIAYIFYIAEMLLSI